MLPISLITRPLPKTTITSLVNPLIRYREEEKWVKIKIVVGLVVTAKVGDMEYNTMDGIIITTRKEAVGYVKYFMGKKSFRIKLKSGKKKYMSTFSLTLV